MFYISMLVAFACEIPYLATRRFSLASLDLSRILIIATMLLACAPKHSPFVNTFVTLVLDEPTASKVALGTLSCDVRYVDSITGPLAIVLVDTYEGILLAL